MKGKAALSHTRRTLLTTRSLSSSPWTVPSSRATTPALDSARASPQFELDDQTTPHKDSAPTGNQLSTQPQPQTDQTWTQQLKEHSPLLHRRTTNAGEGLRARLKFTSLRSGSMVPSQFSTWTMSNLPSRRAPVLMAMMRGTCLEGHRPKTRQALTPSTSVWGRPDTEGYMRDHYTSCSDAQFG